VGINRPGGVLVSAHVSPSERKRAFVSVIAARVFNRSRVDPRQAVEPGHGQHVAGVEHVEQPAKPRGVGLCAARHFAEHLARPMFPQRRHLSGEALAVRRNPRIPIKSWVHFAPKFCTNKRNPSTG
jgi:hypothetical protein